MCIAALAWNPDGETALVLAANRDEFFARPTAPMHWWPNPGSTVLAGRDLKANGAWLGITRGGRFALITNIRNPLLRRAGAPSRGHIVKNFLESTVSASRFVAQLAETAGQYEGFNLLCGEVNATARELCFLNSVERVCKRLESGLYGLSNASLDTDWPKVIRIKQGLRHALAEPDAAAREARLLRLLQNATSAAEQHLPDTGVPRAWERALSSIFIRRDDYGTRSSTLLRMSRSAAHVVELNYADHANAATRSEFAVPISAISSRES